MWSRGRSAVTYQRALTQYVGTMFAPYIYFAFVLLSSWSHVDGARVLGLFPHTGRSHQMVFEPLLKTLADRGHHVTVVSFFPIKNAPPNYTDVSLEGIAPLGVETFDINWVEGSNPFLKAIGLERILEQIYGFHPLAEMALNVCSKIVDLPTLRDVLLKEYDVVLVEHFNSQCMLGLLEAYGVKAPTIGLASSGLMPYSPKHMGLDDNPSFVPTISTQFTDQMTFYERLENTFINTYMQYWFHNFIQMPEQELIQKRLGKKVDLEAIVRNTSLIFINTFHELNGVKPALPGVVEVGGMHLNPNKKPIPDYIERFLNESDEGVILFSWGSLIKTATIPAYKEEILVKALSKFPQKVIWKYENAGPEGNLTGNILRVNWIPQYELLQHKKIIAFIAHGGLLGMTEAISAGKPMLVVPFFGDQPNNAAAAQKAGLAKVLKYSDITEEGFEASLKQVLSAQMRLSARQVSQRWRDRLNHPLDTAVYWTERVARWGHSSQLHSAARDLPYYQLALLDVYSVAILVLVLILLVLRYVLKFILSLSGATLGKDPKKKLH